MGRILAIDYGAKRVGLAVTDPLQIIATALTTVPEKEVIDFLKNYIITENVERFVVGMPLSLNGDDTHATPLVKAFIKRLQKTFPNVPVDTEDEQYTSKMAVQSMVQAGVKKKDRRKKENIDKISATIILQSYLEHY